MSRTLNSAKFRHSLRCLGQIHVTPLAHVIFDGEAAIPVSSAQISVSSWFISPFSCDPSRRVCRSSRFLTASTAPALSPYCPPQHAPEFLRISRLDAALERQKHREILQRCSAYSATFVPEWGPDSHQSNGSCATGLVTFDHVSIVHLGPRRPCR